MADHDTPLHQAFELLVRAAASDTAERALRCAIRVLLDADERPRRGRRPRDPAAPQQKPAARRGRPPARKRRPNGRTRSPPAAETALSPSDRERLRFLVEATGAEGSGIRRETLQSIIDGGPIAPAVQQRLQAFMAG